VSVAVESLIQTKLEAPVPRRLVARRELLARLVDGGAPRRLTLVRAPAGWGQDDASGAAEEERASEDERAAEDEQPNGCT
jgi:ATP/maltotriose-dependent transcriptional regulator MalT